jgi:hypothetical protein
MATRAGALEKRDLMGVLKHPCRRNLSKTIRYPHVLVDPEEYYETRGIIEESKLKYKIDWADSLKGRRYKPTWEPKANVTEVAIQEWEIRKSTPIREVYGSDALWKPRSPTSLDLSIGDVSGSVNRLHKNPISLPNLRNNSPILLGDCSYREVITPVVESLDHSGEESMSHTSGSGPDASTPVKCRQSHNNPCNAKTVRSLSG